MTKTHSRLHVALAVLASVSIVIPLDISAQGLQRAGHISRAIPDVAIARGTQQLAAPEKTLVDWGDVVHTGDGGRARLALDDGSVLNLGSSSSLTVTQHDAAAQQTQIELEYGRVRSQVVKQTKPNAKFEIHTRAGIAGVIGTDFYIGYLNDVMQVIVYEGTVRVCNPAGTCVLLKAGEMSAVRNGDNSAPTPPTQAPLGEVTAAANGTSVEPGTGPGFTEPRAPVHHLSPWQILGLTVLVAIPAIAIPVVMRGRQIPPSSSATGGCSAQVGVAVCAPSTVN